MSFSIVDNVGNVMVNKKNGKPLKDIDDSALQSVQAKFKDKIDSGEIRIVTDKDVRDDNRRQKSFGQRFTETAFPTYAERVQDGDKEFSMGNARALAGDVATLIPRTVVGGLSYFTTPSNKHEKTLGEEIGTRPQDVKLDDKDSWGGFNLAGRARQLVTSPEFAVGLATAPLSEAGYGAAKMFNLGTKASKVLGAIGGAAYGAGLEGVSQAMNPNQDGVDWSKIGASAVGGGAMEGVAQIVRAAISKVGYEQVKEIAAKSWLGGSTNRKLSDDEFMQFMNDPQNAQTLAIALEDAIRVRDQLKSIPGGRDIPVHHVERVADKNAKVFQDAFPNDGKNFAPADFELLPPGAERERARVNYITENINNPEFGVYKNHTLTTPGGRSKSLTPREFNANNFEGHVTHLKRFAETMPESKSGIMTKTESDYIDYLEELFKREQSIAGGSNVHAIPYQIDKALEAKIRQQGSVSDAFNEALNALIHDYEVSSSQLSKKAGAEFGDIRSQLGEIFSQVGDGSGSLVRKDYVGATNSLIKDLQGEVRGISGKPNTSSFNEKYSASNNGTGANIKKLFLDPIQTKLENKTHLDGKDFEELYFKAAKYNYVDVMRYLEDYARKLGVTEDQIKVLHDAGRVPGQLYKLAGGMTKDAPSNVGMFGRVVNMMDPKGVNAVGVKAANYANRNYQTGNWVNRSSNPNGRYTASTALKPTIFNLGRQFFNEKED